MNDVLENYKVTIPIKEFNRLKEDSEMLAKLHAAGVDNWEWYGEALGEEDEEEDV